jgi:hypothetical protein
MLRNERRFTGLIAEPAFSAGSGLSCKDLCDGGGAEAAKAYQNDLTHGEMSVKKQV